MEDRARLAVSPYTHSLPGRRPNAEVTDKPFTDERYLGRRGIGDERKYLPRAFIPTNYVHSFIQQAKAKQFAAMALVSFLGAMHIAHCRLHTQSAIYFLRSLFRCFWACDSLFSLQLTIVSGS